MAEFWKNLGDGIMKSAGNALSGGLSSAVSGLVNGAIGAIFRPSLRQQINSQKELMQEQSRINRENYDYQFDKTSPANMVQLYRDAGLNPGLMYSGNAGSGVRASMGSSSTGSLSPYTGGVMTDPSMIANLENVKADSHLKEKQAENLEEQTKLVELKQISEQLNHLYTQEQTNEVKARIKELEAREQLLLAETQTENELRFSRKAVLDSEAMFNDARSKTEDLLRDPKRLKLESYKRLTDANSVSREFHNWYEKTHHTTMTNGVGALVDRASQMIFGTRGFQETIQNIGKDEVNLVTQIQGVLDKLNTGLSFDFKAYFANLFAKWLIAQTE